MIKLSLIYLYKLCQFSDSGVEP